MKISTIITGFIFFISTIKTKSVIHLDEFFKEIPIESSTAKNYFRVPNYIKSDMTFVFKIYQPYTEFDLDFKGIGISENANDDDIVNGEKWESIKFTVKHSWEDYDIYYYHLNFGASIKYVGVYFSSTQEYKMTFSIRGYGYVFPIKYFEEKMIEDDDSVYFFKAPLVKEKRMEFEVKAYRPVNVFDFIVRVGYLKDDNKTDWECGLKWPLNKELKGFKIQEEDDYISFRYIIGTLSEFDLSLNETNVLGIYFCSFQHYDIGIYLDYSEI